MQRSIKSIVFDVDQTITNSVSWHLITKSLGASTVQLDYLYNKLKDNEISHEEAINKLIQLWEYTGNANYQFMKNALADIPLKKDAQEVIDTLSSKYQLCLISGSMDLYIQTVAENLNIKDWYANSKLIFTSQGKLIDIKYNILQADTKWKQFQLYKNKYKLKDEECAIVGNGEGDKILFERLGKSVLVDSIEKTKELSDLVDIEISEITELLNIF